MKLSHDRFFQLLASLKSGEGVETEQRRQPRVTMRASVLVAPLDDAAVIGPSYAVRLHDLSSSGGSFQHFKPMRRGTEFILDLPDVATSTQDTNPFNAESTSAVRILCRVVHARTAGEHQHVIGAQFLRLWTSPAPTLDAARAA